MELPTSNHGAVKMKQSPAPELPDDAYFPAELGPFDVPFGHDEPEFKGDDPCFDHAPRAY